MDIPIVDEPFVFARDNYIMQYCRYMLTANELTFDLKDMEWTQRHRGRGHFVGMLVEALWEADISLREFRQAAEHDIDDAVQLFTSWLAVKKHYDGRSQRIAWDDEILRTSIFVAQVAMTEFMGRYLQDDANLP